MIYKFLLLRQNSHFMDTIPMPEQALTKHWTIKKTVLKKKHYTSFILKTRLQLDLVNTRMYFKNLCGNIMQHFE